MSMLKNADLFWNMRFLPNIFLETKQVGWLENGLLFKVISKNI